MSGSTKIEWTDTTWNPVRGCSIVSAGCTNCYAMKQAHRFAGPGGAYEGLTTLTNGGPVWTGDVRLVPELLDAPLRWRKSRRVFVNSMSDLFHESVPDTFIDQVFAVMALSPQHTFHVLTKRPERMRSWGGATGAEKAVRGRAWEMLGYMPKYEHHDVISRPWPLPNVWLGVSVENQATADERIPLLLRTPAAVRFVSCEPLLGAVRIDDIYVDGDVLKPLVGLRWTRTPAHFATPGMTVLQPPGPRIDWVIVGGESGPGARPCDVRWIRSVVGQCKAAGTACFVKQIGAQPRGWCALQAEKYIGESERDVDDPDYCDAYEASEQSNTCNGYGRKCHGFDNRKGADPSEWPADLRVREFPTRR